MELIIPGNYNGIQIHDALFERLTGVDRRLAELNSCMDNHNCPFCCPETDRICLESEFAIALFDRFPVTEGHALVVPRRHVANLFDMPDEEQAAVWALVATLRTKLMEDFKPDGFNVGLNDGPAAGQTVMHAHVHIIPRRNGDTVDPRGGVRWIIPEKAAYWGSGDQ